VIKLAAQVCGETYVFDRDLGHQPTLTFGSKLIDNVEFIARRNDLGFDVCLAVQASLTDVDEVGLVEKQKFLNVGSLEKLRKRTMNSFCCSGVKLDQCLPSAARPMASVSRKFVKSTDKAASFSLCV
jgi:hypothetical protein